jgi:carbon storage regulator CsrA
MFSKECIGMLMLTRKIGEKIFIGENNEIVIQIIRMGYGQVMVGIEADKQIPVLREEVFFRDKANSIARNIEAVFSEE